MKHFSATKKPLADAFLDVCLRSHRRGTTTKILRLRRSRKFDERASRRISFLSRDFFSSTAVFVFRVSRRISFPINREEPRSHCLCPRRVHDKSVLCFVLLCIRYREQTWAWVAPSRVVAFDLVIQPRRWILLHPSSLSPACNSLTDTNHHVRLPFFDEH